MAVFSLKPSAICLKKAVIASAILLISAQAQAEPGSERPFLGLSGHWSGAGTVTMADGATERIRCKAAASEVVHHVGPQTPIVMGRSVSLHHKTKLHHVKVKPLDSDENLTSADGSQ